MIVQNRPFYSAKELAEFFYNKLPKGKIHPATLIFQAIRIEVNDELGVLERLFDSLENVKLLDSQLITNFENREYGFVNKRLPVVKLVFDTPEKTTYRGIIDTLAFCGCKSNAKTIIVGGRESSKNKCFISQLIGPKLV
mgnify:CR=1 FL=1